MTNKENSPEISIVIPLYNEEETFGTLIKRVKELCSTVPFSVEVVLVDDGSSDQTSSLMYNLGLNDSLFTCIFLSKNHGHQLAVSAALANVSGTKGAFIIDGDLQDPPELLIPFYEKMKEGYDVIYGVRKKRKEKFPKKSLYWLYYRILKYISDIDIQLDSGDFSLISRRVVDYMVLMPEKSRYLRGMRSWLGFKQYGFEYERQARYAGEPKYTFKKLFELAYNGIFNFSSFPVKFIYKTGLFTMIFTFLYFGYVLFRRFYFGDVPQGFTSLVFIIALFSSVQLISLGLIGEYVIRIHTQAQNRPLFIIDKKIQNQTVIDG